MKPIIYITNTLKRCGPVNLLFDIICHLDRQQYQPYVITLFPEEASSRQQDFDKLGIRRLPLNLPKGWGSFSKAGKITEIVRQVNPVAIHCVGFRADMIGALYFRGYNTISSQVCSPFDDYVMSYGAVHGRIMVTLTVWALKKIKHAVACSREVAAKLEKKGVSTKVIYNAVDNVLFQIPSPEEKETRRRLLKIPANAGPVFIFVGVLSDRKQPTVAIKAFEKYQETCPMSMLLVLGEGPLLEECKRLAKGKRILFLGNVADTRPYLSASDYYIATSKTEGMPLSVLEGLALGLPVILSDIEPHREILSFNPRAGALAKTGSVAATCEAIRELIAKNKSTISEHARSIIDKKLNAKIMSQEYQQYYT
ncbi:MAG: glycosyltransferase family 4 protein [Prevotellaceae bacterium]|jgi:glycosyltransferase involved in cell wall biosynthesis|nr:glycosyltransferase family 4 protein [Prevotellaceae bacterium]